MAFGLSDGKDIVQIIIAAKDMTAAAFAKVQGRLGKLEGTAARVRGTVGKVAKATALIGGAAVIGGIIASTKSFIDFEDAMANVRKTTGLTKDEILDLGKGITDMSKKMPVARTELADIAAIAGQLGIAGKENILGFTETIAMMTTAFDMPADAAATAMAKVSKIYDIPIEQVSNLGSAINVLGNTTAAKEHEIMSFSMSLGATAKNLGFTATESLAMGATLISMGMDASDAGTRLNRAFIQIGQKVDEVSEFLGMSEEEFKKAFGEDPMNMLIQISTKLSAIEDPLDRNTAGAKMFGAVGAKAIVGLGGDLAGLRANIDNAGTGFEENTSLIEEFGNKTDTLKAKFTILKNTITAALGGIGAAIAPTLTPLVEKFREAIPAIMAFLSKLKDDLQPTFESLKGIFSSAKKILKELFSSEDKDKISTFANAINKLMGFVEKLFKFLEKHPGLVKFGLAIGTVVVAISYAIPIIQSLITTIAAIKTAMIALNVFMAANPIVLILMAIVVAIGLLYYAWTHNWGGIQDKVKAVIAFLTPAFEWIKNKLNAVKKYLPLLLGPIGAVYLAFKNWDKIKAVVGKLKDAISDKFSAMKDKISDFTSKIQDKLGLTKKELLMMASPAGPIVLFKKAWDKNLFGIQDKVREAMDTVKEKISNAISTIREKIESISDLPGKAYQWGKDLIQNFIDGIGAMISELKAKIEEAMSFIPDFMKPGSGTKLGPLRTLDEWGPKLIKTFAEGIEKGLPELNATFKTMAIPFETTTIAGSSSSSRTSVVNINIGSVDSQETADYFIDKIERVMKKGAVI